MVLLKILKEGRSSESPPLLHGGCLGWFKTDDPLCISISIWGLPEVSPGGGFQGSQIFYIATCGSKANVLREHEEVCHLLCLSLTNIMALPLCQSKHESQRRIQAQEETNINSTLKKKCIIDKE